MISSLRWNLYTMPPRCLSDDGSGDAQRVSGRVGMRGLSGCDGRGTRALVVYNVCVARPRTFTKVEQFESGKLVDARLNRAHSVGSHIVDERAHAEHIINLHTIRHGHADPG
jgi:hypothetical protein